MGPPAHDAARIVDAVGNGKVGAVRRRRRYDCRAAPAVNHSALRGAVADRADRDARSVHVAGLAECVAGWNWKLRNHAVLPDHRQVGRAVAKLRIRTEPHHNAAVVGTVRHEQVAADRARQTHETAALGPGERLARAAIQRTSDGDPGRRHAKTLRFCVVRLHHAEVVNLILRIGHGRGRHKNPRDERGNLGARSDARVCLDVPAQRKPFSLLLWR